MKKFLKVILALCLVISFFGNAPEVYAASSLKPEIKSVDYDGKGKVRVTFKKDTYYEDQKVKVTGPEGESYTAVITSESKRGIDFKVSKLKTNGKYKFKIYGIKVKDAKKYSSVSDSFKVNDYKDSSQKEAEPVSIRRAVYDTKDRELKISFNVKVKYKNEKVTVKDSSGKKYTATILEKDKDGMEIRVKRLKKDKKYTITVSGVKNRDSDSYETVKKTFRY